MNISTIIFDCFGVISSEVAPFWFEKYFSPEEATELKRKHCRPADEGRVSFDEFFENLGVLVRKTSAEVKHEFEVLSVVNEEVIDLIRILNEKSHLGLCSNAMAEFVRPIIERYELEKFFDVVVISSEVGVRKPDSRIYEHVLKQFSVAPEECVFIDDQPKYLEVPKELGMKTILFSSAEETKKELEKYGIEFK